MANQRRRRLRLIKTIEERTAEQFQSAASALSIASESEFARLDSDAIRQKLLAECRVKTSSILRIEHPGAPPMDVAMNRPYVLIGSDPVCDVQLEHDQIKPRHSFLQWIDGHLFCSDVGRKDSYFPRQNSQSNGCWIDDEPVSIGPYRFSLVGIDSSPRPDFFPLDRSARLAGEFPYLAFHFDGVEQADNQWPVNRMLTMIGRAPQCKLRLNHPSMGYVQAALIRTSIGCWLVDIAKDGTTCVNGRAIQVSPVDIGDELLLGAFRVDVVSMEAPSVVTVAHGTPANQKFGIGPSKSLPPIRFDRQPKKTSRKSATAGEAQRRETPSRRAEIRKELALQDAEKLMHQSRDQVPEQLPQVVGSGRPTDGRQELFVNDDNRVPLEMFGAVVTVSAVAQVESDPVRGAIAMVQRQEFDQPNEAPQAVCLGLPPDRHEELIVNDHREVPQETPIDATDVVTHDLSRQEESNVTEPIASATTVTGSGPTKIDIDATPAPVVEFLRQQQRELDVLKKQLNELKRIYEAAAGQLISKKIRESLEKPVTETMQCHDSMQEKLARFLQQVER